MNPITNPNPNQLDPFLLPPSFPYLENPNPTFTTLPFVDYVLPPLPPLLPTYSNSTSGNPSHCLPFPYPVSGDPLALVKREDGIGVSIGLNLGQRTYFNNTRSVFGFGAYGSGQNLNQLSCQVDGCKTDLTGAKHYHRRHKVCEFHSKAPMVLLGGLQERFCQQCSRFHVVAEFDEAKRSCRKRLADHNRRRRKSQFPSIDPVHASHKMKSSTSTTSAPNKPTNDTSSITNNSTTSMSSTSCNLEGSHARIQSKVQAPEKFHGTTILSLGEVENLNSDYPNHNLDIYHEQNPGDLPFPTLMEEKQPFFHHQNIFGSSSNKGQALLEVDFMQ